MVVSQFNNPEYKFLACSCNTVALKYSVHDVSRARTVTETQKATKMSFRSAGRSQRCLSGIQAVYGRLLSIRFRNYQGLRDGGSNGVRLNLLVILALPALFLAGCEQSADLQPSTVAETQNSAGSAGGGLPVVCTYSILADWVREVGAEHVQLTTLVGPGGDAHTYEPTPQDSAALADAGLVFENGFGFEVWLDRLFDSSQSKATRVVVTRPIQGRTISDGHDDHPSGDHGEVDPHVWHDPAFAVQMVREIESALTKADPGHTQDYQKNAQNYIAQLEELHAWIQQQVSGIPEARRKLVTTHDTFGYFAARYGFSVSSVMGTVSSEVADPSAAQIAAIIEHIRRERVPAVFAENILNPQLTEQVAREAGVLIVPTLFTDALGSEGSGGEAYLQMMQSNVTKMVESLR